MRHVYLLCIVAFVAGLAAPDAKAQADDKCYELRTYTAPDGRLDDLNRRFAKYTRPVFFEYGMDGLGYWIPIDNPDNQFIDVLSYPDCVARDSSWARFFRDPDWLHAKAITEAQGDIVTNVESVMMDAADFSPTIGPASLEYERVFELRTYTPHEGKFEDLLARFRDHTLRIFEKHGMQNVAYWIDQDEERLIYILAFPGVHAQYEAWREFIADPEWQQVAEESHRDGPLVANIESVTMRPTVYSEMR
ncbi:MAG: NIPSNAP family protein [Rhodothermales bacterium]